MQQDLWESMRALLAKKRKKKFRNEKWDTAVFFFGLFSNVLPECNIRCKEVERSTLRLAFFRQWPFNNSDPFLYSLYIISFLKLTCNTFYNFLKFSGNVVNVDMLYFTLVWKHVLNEPLLLLLLLLLSWSFFTKKCIAKGKRYVFPQEDLSQLYNFFFQSLC